MEVEGYKMIYKIKANEEFMEDINKEDIRKIKKINNNRILGNYFVKNNKNKALLIINNKKYKLKEFINPKEFKGDKIKINIILSKDWLNISHIFENCYGLEELLFYDNTIYINDIGDEENYKLDKDNCNNFDYIEDINNDRYNNFYKNLRNDDIISYYSVITKREEKYDNSTINYIKDKIIIYQYNYYDICYMFYNCASLPSLPDISKWNTNKVINMSYMFYNCSSLLLLPDISKWNTNNVTDMSYMFYNCSSLSSLPDISKWNTSNVTDMSALFSGYSSLISLPDKSKLKAYKETNLSNINMFYNMYYDCLSLLSLPEMYHINPLNSTNNTLQFSFMTAMFYSCDSILNLTLPELSKRYRGKIFTFFKIIGNV